jgi:hypothetical protein
VAPASESAKKSEVRKGNTSASLATVALLASKLISLFSAELVKSGFDGDRVFITSPSSFLSTILAGNLSTTMEFKGERVSSLELGDMPKAGRNGILRRISQVRKLLSIIRQFTSRNIKV